MPNLVKIAPQDSKIFMRFEDGVECQMLPIDLRFECPCASCVDEITGKRTLKKGSIKPDIKVMKIEPVGRYGIHIDWSDGHRTGMYHFDRLYEMAKRQSLG